jgi:formamidopyrimidine-DNA glycosylase
LSQAGGADDQQERSAVAYDSGGVRRVEKPRVEFIEHGAVSWKGFHREDGRGEMPELPDILHVVSRLRARLAGLSVATERVCAPSALRFTVPGNLSLLLGRRVEDVTRHGHYIMLRFEGLDLVVNAATGGRFRFADPTDKDEAALIFALGFHVIDARGHEQATVQELRFLGEKKASKTYLTAASDRQAVPGMDAVGVDILSAQFTPERLVSLLKHRRDPVRVMLVDKRALDSLGNVFADAVMFDAGIHPKTSCHELTHEQALRLHDAIARTVKNAVDEAAQCDGDESLDVKARGVLRARMKSTCPRCGSGVRTIAIRAMEARYCPHCQPAGKSRPIVGAP